MTVLLLPSPIRFLISSGRKITSPTALLILRPTIHKFSFVLVTLPCELIKLHKLTMQMFITHALSVIRVHSLCEKEFSGFLESTLNFLFRELVEHLSRHFLEQTKHQAETLMRIDR